MVRLIFLFLIFTSFTFSQNIYERNCVKCHKKLPVSIDKYFYRYLLKYSSENDVKTAIRNYLNKPSKKSTVMPKAFIKRFGIKKATSLPKEQLDEALNLYWEKYKVFGKLK